MSVVYVGNEIERLREIYPEIPENVIGLRITLELDSVTKIECAFNPVDKKPNKVDISLYK